MNTTASATTRTTLTIHIRGGLFSAETVREKVTATLPNLGWDMLASRVEDAGSLTQKISFDVDVPTAGLAIGPISHDHTDLVTIQKTLARLHERNGIVFRAMGLGRR